MAHKKYDVQTSLSCKGRYIGESMSANGINGSFSIWLSGYNSTGISLSKENALKLAQHIKDYYESRRIKVSRNT